MMDSFQATMMIDWWRGQVVVPTPVRRSRVLDFDKRSPVKPLAVLLALNWRDAGPQRFSAPTAQKDPSDRF
jgi:hypothetical protein